MNEFTYILGAGASYHSMPLMENFPKRFQYYLNYLKSTPSPNDKADVDFIKLCETFLQEVEVHFSFDTLFKKLFHRKENDIINRYKIVLLFFFVFEHLTNLQSYKKTDYVLQKRELLI